MNPIMKLLGFLNRVFDKDPRSVNVVSFSCDGTATWTVAGGVLRTTVVGGTAGPLEIVLDGLTLQGLSDAIDAAPGYAAALLDPGRASRSATIVRDDAGVEDASGVILQAYTSILWSWAHAITIELGLVRTQVEAAPAQMEIGTSTSMWVDEIGSYYGLERQSGETDEVYGSRVVAETLQPLGNNVALERAIEALSGARVTVTDVTSFGDVGPRHDGTITHGSVIVTEELRHRHNVATQVFYGLFDVAVDEGYEALAEAAMPEILAFIERARDAGFHLRTFETAPPSEIILYTEGGLPIEDEDGDPLEI